MNASSDFTILPPKVPGPRSKLQALEEGGENVVTLASPKTVGVLTHPCFFFWGLFEGGENFLEGKGGGFCFDAPILTQFDGPSRWQKERKTGGAFLVEGKH